MLCKNGPAVNHRQASDLIAETWAAGVFLLRQKVLLYRDRDKNKHTACPGTPLAAKGATMVTPARPGPYPYPRLPGRGGLESFYVLQQDKAWQFNESIDIGKRDFFKKG